MKGYIFNFSSHGPFSPEGKVQEPMSQADIDAHNRRLAEAEWQAMLQTGRGLLYYDGATISDWPGLHTLPKDYANTSNQFVPNAWQRCQRVDVWFSIPGDGRWHGIQRGDNQILRVRKLKS